MNGRQDMTVSSELSSARGTAPKSKPVVKVEVVTTTEESRGIGDIHGMPTPISGHAR